MPVFTLSILILLTQLVHAIEPDQILVIYNKNVPESKSLADEYAAARQVPATHLVGLDVEDTIHISRSDYDSKIRQPLREQFTQNGWWIAPVDEPEHTWAIKESKIKVILCLRGIPYKIKRAAEPFPNQNDTPDHFKNITEASVDSELATLAVSNAPLTGPSPNPYFQKNSPFATTPLPWALLLVNRIDGPSWEDCKRLITEPIEIEKSGLWGNAYVDQAQKQEMGDNWLKNITQVCDREGIPCILDVHKDTFVTNYPLNQASIYFGWYQYNRNGFLLNPKFRFRPGAVAVHLHSFSAELIRDKNQRWCGALIAAGACATLGNVYEPYLGVTHHLDLFFERLIAGYTLAEAAAMAHPAVSWQQVVIGDPLYRPFKHFANATGDENTEEDRAFRALRLAHLEWPHDHATRTTKLRGAAARMNSGTLYEAIGQQLLRQDRDSEAAAFFSSAKDNFLLQSDKLRQDLHLIDILRRNGKKQMALNDLTEAIEHYQNIQEKRALIAIRNILHPPPPKPKDQQPPSPNPSS